MVEIRFILLHGKYLKTIPLKMHTRILYITYKYIQTHARTHTHARAQPCKVSKFERVLWNQEHKHHIIIV